jgi:hypothetical protein
MPAGPQGFIQVGTGSKRKCEQCCQSFGTNNYVNCGNLCAMSQRDCNNSKKNSAALPKKCPVSDSCCGDEFEVDYDECYY